MPINFMAIIGHSGVGKSAATRALTGAHQVQPNWNIAYLHGNFPTYIHVRGLQESGVSAQGFINAVRAAGVQHVIAVMRTNSNKLKGIVYPDAASYLSAFRSAGWAILPHAELVDIGIGPAPSLAPFTSSLLIAGGLTLPSNGVAAQLRKLWNII